MNRSSLAFALAAITLAGLSVWQHLKNAELIADIDVLHKSQAHWNKDSQDQLDQFNTTIAALRQQLQDVQNQLALAKAPPAAATAVVATVSGNTPTAAPLLAATPPIPPAATNQSAAAMSPRPLAPGETIAERVERGKVVMREMFGQNLQFQAPGLTEQNRAYTVDALVEAMTAPFTPASRAGKSQAEITSEMNDAVINKLQSKMDESQLQLVKAYFKDQSRMNQARGVGR